MPSGAGSTGARQDRRDLVVVVSDRLQRYLTSVVGTDSSNTRTVRNGVDTDVFTPAPEPEGLKGQLRIPDEQLIELVSELRRTKLIRRSVALVVGDGSHKVALEQRARDLNLGDVVRFPGWIDVPADYYRLFDVFALTSRSEGPSISLLEAMSCGTPPVAMAAGAPPRYCWERAGTSGRSRR